MNSLQTMLAILGIAISGEACADWLAAHTSLWTGAVVLALFIIVVVGIIGGSRQEKP